MFDFLCFKYTIPLNLGVTLYNFVALPYLRYKELAGIRAPGHSPNFLSN